MTDLEILDLSDERIILSELEAMNPEKRNEFLTWFKKHRSQLFEVLVFKLKKPNWVVFYNIVSPESDEFIGTGREFFTKEEDAKKCMLRHENSSKRPYHKSDKVYLGAVHQ